MLNRYYIVKDSLVSFKKTLSRQAQRQSPHATFRLRDLAFYANCDISIPQRNWWVFVHSLEILFVDFLLRIVSSSCLTGVELCIAFCNIAHPLQGLKLCFLQCPWEHFIILNKSSHDFFLTRLMNKTLLSTGILCFPPRWEAIKLLTWNTCLEHNDIYFIMCASLERMTY